MTLTGLLFLITIIFYLVIRSNQDTVLGNFTRIQVSTNLLSEISQIYKEKEFLRLNDNSFYIDGIDQAQRDSIAKV